MSFIDWSDPDEMFDLLVEYVGDEKADADDPARRSFLARLIRELGILQNGFGLLSPAQRSAALCSLHAAIDAEFADDPVVEHLAACAEELERIQAKA